MKDAIKEYGKENVINATIGSLYDENENLLGSIMNNEVYRTLPPEEIYMHILANVIGEDDYLEEVFKNFVG